MVIDGKDQHGITNFIMIIWEPWMYKILCHSILWKWKLRPAGDTRGEVREKSVGFNECLHKFHARRHLPLFGFSGTYELFSIKAVYLTPVMIITWMLTWTVFTNQTLEMMQTWTWNEHCIKSLAINIVRQFPLLLVWMMVCEERRKKKNRKDRWSRPTVQYMRKAE